MTTTLPEDFRPEFEAGASIAPHHAARAPRAISIARQAHVVIPLLILVILAAPRVTFLLPATRDYLGETYQPIRALKFFKTRGQPFHKYGPAPNFILAPGYGATLAYWKATGSLAQPSDRFPYGFARPFEQMGFLILQGRVIFLLIGVVALAYLAQALHAVTNDRWAVGFALLFCVVTNHALVDQLPSPRPDGGMIAFSALALALYLRMVFAGLTVPRGVWFSIWAVLAISSKEMAAPMFVLPFVGLVALAHRQHSDAARRTIGWSLLSGVIAYALLNIVYAPQTWAERMRFWIAGPGIDADVWGNGGGLIGWLASFGQCMLDNLGPGGIVIVPVALGALLIARPPRWVMLILPAVSVTALGLAQIEYPTARFYTILSLALVLPVAVGLAAIMQRPPRAKAIASAAMLALGALNLWFATFAYFHHDAIFEYAAERHALARHDREATYYLFNTYPHIPGATRLELLGLKHDARSVQQLAAQRTDLPEWVYATHGQLQFYEDARKLPARAAMIKSESGFDIAAWSGFEGLGYQHVETLSPQVPGWFPFTWMPAVERWRRLGTVEVYRLGPETTASK